MVTLPPAQPLQGSLFKEPAFPRPVLVLLKLGTALAPEVSGHPALPRSAPGGGGKRGGGSQAATRLGLGSRVPSRSSGAGRNRLSGCVQVLGASASPTLNEDRSPIERLEEMPCGRGTCSQVASAVPS